MTEENESWLPNLVGGVSIWKLAPDLNEDQFFDGRLLVPETEGSDSLPVRVEWDLTGMIPLPEARETHPEKVKAAIEEFFACLERTAEVFEKGGSGYDKYKAAFTVPALDADGGAHYFFDAADDKLKVINWGASPRKIRHEKHYLFGYQDFGALIRKEQEALASHGGSGGTSRARSAGGASVEDEPTDSAAAPEGEEKGEEKKDDEKKEEEEKGTVWGKPWWVWILYVIGLIFLILLAFALLQDCAGKRDQRADAAVSADGGDQAIYGHSADDAGPAATDLHPDGGVDGSVAASDAAVSADAAANADASAASDGGAGSGDGSGDGSQRDAGAARGRDAGPSRASGPPRRSDGRPIYGRSRDPSGAYRYWIEGRDGRGVSLPHREYYHPDAMQWRIVSGTEKVYDFSGAGSTFWVYLRPGEDFDGVHVQWRDRAGNWHEH